MASFKRLKRSDVISVPYVANKNWVFNYSPYPTSDQYIKIYKGTNLTGSFSLDYDPITEGRYERLVYSQINHLFYQQYSASANLIDSHSLAASLYYEGASQNRITGSDFIYNDNQGLVKLFPTGANEGIRVLSISQDLYGQQILPYAFELSSSVYYIKDDGIGNLIDLKNSSTHVGNIFYSHGLAVITNQDYQLAFPLPPLAPKIIATFPTSSDFNSISVDDIVDGRGATVLTGSIILSNTSSFITDGNGGIVLDTREVGTYYTNYTISSSLTSSIYSGSYFISNIASVTASVYNDFIPPTPTPTTSVTPTPTPTAYVVSIDVPNPPVSASVTISEGIIPGDPYDIVTSCSGSSAIRLTWFQPSPYRPTEGYIVGYRKANSNATFAEFITTSFSDVLITGIVSGVNYEGYVRSFNGNGLVSGKISWYHKCT
jgi:hypothetical protein